MRKQLHCLVKKLDNENCFIGCIIIAFLLVVLVGVSLVLLITNNIK